MSKSKVTTKPGLSFSEFAAARKRTQCATCSVDPKLLSEINAARQSGGSYDAIAAWLREARDIDLSASAIRNHFVGGHHV